MEPELGITKSGLNAHATDAASITLFSIVYELGFWAL